MSFGIAARARSRKAKGGLRALLGKAPDAQEVGERLVRLARRALKGAVRDASAKRLTLQLHPNASPIRIVVLPDGDLELKADTSTVGPGYHAEVLARLAPIFEELEYTLEDEAGDPQSRMTAWLAAELRAGARRIGMPPDRAFKLDAPVLTAMGPRDAAWRDAVLADPSHGLDAFAWTTRGPGHDARSRALLAMWLEVPWREPLDDAERALMEGVNADLLAARQADKTLELPWPEWAELLDHLGSAEDHVARVRKRAGDRRGTIGYRRYPMDIELAGGWTIELAGSFVSHWEDDGERWWATDGERLVEFTSLTAGDESDPVRLLGVAPEVHPVIARLAEDTRLGRIEAHTADGVHVAHGLMVSAPHVGILTCKSTPAAIDVDWALATWRSLQRLA